MKDAARLIAELPGSTPVSVTVGSGTMTADELRVAFVASQQKRILTTYEASRIFGYSASQWQKWAAAGDLPDAYQDVEGGHWRLPYEACDAHVRRRIDRGLRRGGPRGPWSAAEGVPRPRLEVVEASTEAPRGLRLRSQP